MLDASSVLGTFEILSTFLDQFAARSRSARGPLVWDCRSVRRHRMEGLAFKFVYSIAIRFLDDELALLMRAIHGVRIKKTDGCDGSSLIR